MTGAVRESEADTSFPLGFLLLGWCLAGALLLLTFLASYARLNVHEPPTFLLHVGALLAHVMGVAWLWVAGSSYRRTLQQCTAEQAVLVRYSLWAVALVNAAPYILIAIALVVGVPL